MRQHFVPKDQMKTLCPKCDRLVDIFPTNKKIADGWAATWMKIAPHDKPGLSPYRAELCEGSGKLV